VTEPGWLGGAPMALRARVGGDQGQDVLSAPVAVLTVAEAKGLEFDSVLVVDPAGMLEESPRGASDLYVALTRATQRLGVVHSGELPPVLARLRSASALSAPRS
jgi:superfamily I DNA/RNA helicase